jgi:uncharacterized protein
VTYYRRFLKAPKQSFFLFGARGTGKSTWLHHQLDGAFWIDLLDPERLRFYGSKPERLLDAAAAHPGVIVIDEVQKLPQLLSVVHAVIEQRRGTQFVLTGSSARKLKREGVDLLAGRALLTHMHPFMAAELGDQFDLDRALMQGLLPLVWEAPDPAATLRSYVALYLKEEVQAEGLVRRIGDFARFLEVVSFSHASLLNVSNIARECDVARTTVESYVQILQDLLLGFQLRVFTKRAQRATSSHPKFYLFDAGIYRALRATGPLDKPQEMDGAALEGLVAQHLRAWLDLQPERHDLHFWRTRTGLEVDFVVYGPTGFWAIEVKNSRRLAPADTRGLLAFKEEYPEAKLLLLYRGPQKMERGVLCMPCDTFLRQLQPTESLSP